MKNKLALVGSLFISTLLFAQVDTQKINEYLDARYAYGDLNGVVSISKKGKTLFEKAYGFADREWEVPTTLDTKFRLASVSKQFTAMVILQLFQETKLHLNDNISKHLPYYRKDIGEKVNIRQLLTHCSGIPGYTELDSFFVKGAKLHYTTKEFVLKYCSNDLEFEPGTQLKYNNSAYFILGAIIEEIEGDSYANVIDKRIFKKLNMENSGYDWNLPIIKKRARGYSKNENGDLINAHYVDMSVPFSAGSLYSTLEDLRKWDRSFYSYLLLTPQYTDSMFAKQKEDFGYGWVISKLFKKQVFLHSGGINGFSTVIMRFPEDETCIIVLENFEFGNAPRVGRDLAAILYGESYVLPKKKVAIQLEPQLLQTYVGTYQLAPDFEFVITLNDGNLMIQATGQSNFPLYAETEKDFFLEVVEASLTFKKDKKGKVIGLVLHQNGDHEAKKIK